MTRTTANLIIMLITIVWGLGFILTKLAINNNMSPAMINIIRGAIFASLTLFFFFPKIKTMSRYDMKIGMIVGIFNFLGFISQTIGAQFTTPSNNAFLTVTSVVMVPFIVWAIYKKRPPLKIFISIALCMYGMAWLTGFIRISYIMNIGDVLSVMCAFFFAMSIAILGNSAKKCEFGVIAFMMGICHLIGSVLYFVIGEGALISGDINWAMTLVPVVFLGIFGSFMAQTGQVYAQRFTTASAAALIMTLEGLFGAIFSVIFGYDIMSRSLVLGGALIMISLVISEYDFSKRRLHRTVEVVDKVYSNNS